MWAHEHLLVPAHEDTDVDLPDPKVALMRTVPLFRVLPDASLTELARWLDLAEAVPGRPLLVQGAYDVQFGIVATGCLHVLMADEVIAELRAGDVFGEIAMLWGGARSASVVAAEPSRLLVTHRHGFNAVLDADPAIRGTVEATARARMRWNGGYRAS